MHLREKNVRHDIISGVIEEVLGANEGDIVRLTIKIDALARFLDSDDGAVLLGAYRRALNILTIEESRDGRRYSLPVKEALFDLPSERSLLEALDVASGTVSSTVARDRFDEAMAALARLRQPVDEFFERVTVNVDDKDLRENRLRLLSRIRATMNQVADFSQIEG